MQAEQTFDPRSSDAAWEQVLRSGGDQPSPIGRGMRIQSNSHISVPRGTRTPLHDAARMGMTDVVASMIEDGADVNAVDENGMTPLHDAAQAGHTKVPRRASNKG